jgi:hypothetical protein
MACLPASPAAASEGGCTQVGVLTFSPALPKDSNPSKVRTAVTLVGNFSSCRFYSGVKRLPITSGQVKYVSGKTSGSNCTTFKHGERYPKEKIVFHWNTGASWPGSMSVSTTNPLQHEAQEIGWTTDGLFTGDLLLSWPNDGSCTTKGLSKIAYKSFDVSFGLGPL